MAARTPREEQGHEAATLRGAGGSWGIWSSSVVQVGRPAGIHGERRTKPSSDVSSVRIKMTSALMLGSGMFNGRMEGNEATSRGSSRSLVWMDARRVRLRRDHER